MCHVLRALASYSAVTLLCLGASVGCGDDAVGSSNEALGALESLGEYAVTETTCGAHWSGVFALSANRVAQHGQGTDQLFVEPADPASPANRGRGSLAADGNFSLQISFDVDDQFLVYQCTGALDEHAILMQCDMDGQPRCNLAFAVEDGM